MQDDYPFKQYLYNVGVEPDIAEGVYINGLIDCGAKVTIEKDVFTGHGVMILTGSHNYKKRGVHRSSENLTWKPVTIKEGVWLGSGVIICAGVTIGKHAVIGAGSVVLKDVPARELWAGNPAEFKKKV